MLEIAVWVAAFWERRYLGKDYRQGALLDRLDGVQHFILRRNGGTVA